MNIVEYSDLNRAIKTEIKKTMGTQRSFGVKKFNKGLKCLQLDINKIIYLIHPNEEEDS